MSKGLIYILFILLIITYNIKSDSHDYLKKVIDRLNDIEVELKTLQSPINKSVSKEKTNLNYINSIANHEQRLVDIEEELRSLNGLLEQVNYKIDKFINTPKLSNETEKIKKMYTLDQENIENSTQLLEENNIIVLKDPNVEKNPTMKVLGTVSDHKKSEKDQKVGNVENENNQDKILSNKSIKESDQQNILSNDQLTELSKNPSEIYRYAYNMLIRENFIEAENSFKAFIGEHPNDPLASNAYYWLGETYYVQKNFQLAAVSFARGFQKFPKGNKSLDQLFKLALTFLNLGKIEDACATFSKLESEFPDAPKRISNRAKEYIQRAKC